MADTARRRHARRLQVMMRATPRARTRHGTVARWRWAAISERGFSAACGAPIEAGHARSCNRFWLLLVGGTSGMRCGAGVETWPARGGPFGGGGAPVTHAGRGRPGAWIEGAASQLPHSRAPSRARNRWRRGGATAHARLGLRRAAKCATRTRATPRGGASGDAALALDPLSGRPLYEALRGARCGDGGALGDGARGDSAAGAALRRGGAGRSWNERRAAPRRPSIARNAARGAFWSETATGTNTLLRTPHRPRARRTPSGALRACSKNRRHRHAQHPTRRVARGRCAVWCR